MKYNIHIKTECYCCGNRIMYMGLATIKREQAFKNDVLLQWSVQNISTKVW